MNDASANARRLTATTAEQTRWAEHSASSALNGVRECYLRFLDMARENTVAGFDVARELASVQTPSEFAEVLSARAREAYGTFSEQTKELSNLAQKMATSTAHPLTNVLTSPFRQA